VVRDATAFASSEKNGLTAFHRGKERGEEGTLRLNWRFSATLQGERRVAAASVSQQGK